MEREAAAHVSTAQPKFCEMAKMHNHRHDQHAPSPTPRTDAGSTAAATTSIIPAQPRSQHSTYTSKPNIASLGEGPGASPNAAASIR